MTMTPKEEEAYVQGSERAWTNMLSECIRQLPPGPSKDDALWRRERSETVLKLRWLAKKLDARWSDELYLPDNVENLLDALAEKGVL